MLREQWGKERGHEPEGPGARLCGGSAVLRILDFFQRVLRSHSWDFRRGPGGSGESPGWVTWPWAE